MNNKGQSLVLFILIIPILLGMIVLVYDVGNAVVKKNKINNVIEMIVEDSLNEDYEFEKVEKLVQYNLSTNNYSISVSDNEVNIKVEDYVDGIISNVIGFKGFKIVSQYKGYVKDEKNVIEKVRQ